MEMKPQPYSYNGLIFDFNGVLFLDESIQRESWRSFASQFREETLSNEEIDIHVHGRNGKHTLEYILGYPTTQIETDRLIEQKEVIYRQMCLDLGDSFTLSPGAVDLLDNLVKHNIPFTIATASRKNNVDFFVTYLRLDT